MYKLPFDVKYKIGPISVYNIPPWLLCVIDEKYSTQKKTKNGSSAANPGSSVEDFGKLVEIPRNSVEAMVVL